MCLNTERTYRIILGGSTAYVEQETSQLDLVLGIITKMQEELRESFRAGLPMYERVALISHSMK